MCLRLQGVSEASERPGFFKRIMEANVPGISKAYAAAEALFAQLQVCLFAPSKPAKLTYERHNCSMFVTLFSCTVMCCSTKRQHAAVTSCPLFSPLTVIVNPISQSCLT